MRDGNRIAIDVNLPVGIDGPVPTIVRQTRYHRRRRMRGPFDVPAVHKLFDNQYESRQFFVRRGYAWVDVCARGSGASEGSRPCPWSNDEIRDGAEIVDWIVRQKWSNGLVGARGISYDGTAAEFLASNRHPAVRAVAPRFSLFDTYEDIAMPGGIHLEQFTANWARFNDALDRDSFAEVLAMILDLSRGAREQLARGHYAQKIDTLVTMAMALRGPVARRIGGIVPGVAPVDEDPVGELVQEFVRYRTENLDVHQASKHMVYRDDLGLSEIDPEMSVNDFSPHTHMDELKGSVAFYHYSGWFDGAYQRSAVKRFWAHDDPNHKLILGPWEHGAEQNISVFEPSRKTLFEHNHELMAFFDAHLRDDEERAAAWADQPRVRYFTIGEEKWKTADDWPPPGATLRRFHLGDEERLYAEAVDESTQRLPVSGLHGTGAASRWRCLLPTLALTHYGPREGAEVVSYTSDPLTEDLEVTGHPLAHIELVSTTPDPRLFVYLEDVESNGTAHYVTEGQLRAIHRRSKRKKPASHRDIPYRTFERADHRPAPPGELITFELDLLPCSWLFEKGHSVRIVLSGADADHFDVGPPGVHTIYAHRSWVELPTF